jgi:hypothetical protein
MSEVGDSGAPARELRATFASPEQMQEAINRLPLSGFDRADLSLPSPRYVEGKETPEAGTKPASTEADARQSRTLGASTVASVAAMAAAGVTVATGGAAAPAVAAAALVGAAAGGAVFAGHDVANRLEQLDRDERAETGHLVLAVRVPTEQKRAEAEAVLRAAGATDIEVIK